METVDKWTLFIFGLVAGVIANIILISYGIVDDIVISYTWVKITFFIVCIVGLYFQFTRYIVIGYIGSCMITALIIQSMY